MAKKIQEYKDWIYIIVFSVTILSGGAKLILLADQIKRNEKAIIKLEVELKEAELGVLNSRLERIEESVDKIYKHLIEQ